MVFPNKLRTVYADKLRCKLSLDIADVLDESHNLRAHSRGIRSIGSFEKTAFSRACKKVVFVKDNNLYALTDTGVVRFNGETTQTVLPGKFDDCTCVDYNGTLVFTTPKATYKFTDVAKLATVGLNGVTICDGRLVGVGNARVAVSPHGQLWESAMTLNLLDTCQGITSIGKKAYILGDTCYCFEPRYVEVDAKFHPIATGVGNVLTDSIVELGRKTFFASDKGLFVLLPSGLRAVFKHLGSICTQNAAACMLKNNVLLSCKRSSKSLSNDITLLLDVDTNRVVGVYEWGFDALYSDKNKVYGVKNKEVFCYEDEFGEAVYKVSNIDFGTDCTKFLDKLAIRSLSNADVFVQSDGKRDVFTCLGSPLTRQIALCGSGKEFSVEVHASDGMELEYIELFAHATREV